MHRVLQIQELLLNIFSHCVSGLPALAGTCRTFKEPALDVLWGNLVNPSALVRCLPEASHCSRKPPPPVPFKQYALTRPLTQIEWTILRSYTRRIRSLGDYLLHETLDWESVTTFLNPATTEPLFPNLRYLYATHSGQIAHLLSIPFPSIMKISLVLGGEDLDVLQDSLESFFKSSKNIQSISILSNSRYITFNDVFSVCVCRWQNLQNVQCPGIALGMDALSHLSQVPALTHLTFKLSTTLPDQLASTKLFLFANLRKLTLYSRFLDSVSRLLSLSQLPVITDLSASVKCYFSKQDFSTFFAIIQRTGLSQTLQELDLHQQEPFSQDEYVPQDPRPVLQWEDIQPLAEFNDLLRILINIDWQVDLTDNGLLALASAKPELRQLYLNDTWGWRTSCGITPNGLLRLLQTCQSLGCVSLAMDMRGYTTCSGSPTDLGRTSERKVTIDVLDSLIEAESVPAAVAFFASLVPFANLFFWCGLEVENAEYQARWEDVSRRIDDTVSQVFKFVRV